MGYSWCERLLFPEESQGRRSGAYKGVGQSLDVAIGVTVSQQRDESMVLVACQARAQSWIGKLS